MQSLRQIQAAVRFRICYAAPRGLNPPIVRTGLYPNQIFTVVIWVEDRCKFGEPEIQFKGKRFVSPGEISNYHGVPEIIGRSVNQPRRAIKQSGVNHVVLLALSDSGHPSYEAKNADVISSFGCPVFACTPDLFPSMMAAALSGKDLQGWAAETRYGAHPRISKFGWRDRTYCEWLNKMESGIQIFVNISSSIHVVSGLVIATFSDSEISLTLCKKVPDHGKGLAGIPINNPFPLYISCFNRYRVTRSVNPTERLRKGVKAIYPVSDDTEQRLR